MCKSELCPKELDENAIHTKLSCKKIIQFVFSNLDCECKREGTEVCDHTNGDCTCLEGVEGIRCDRCMPDHWGFDVSDRVSS